ncbi:hypothetical protein BDV37DRAFT_250853 [Aspergillus pseudonomiae]|uniref:Rhodopsin domain-containing protein n=1 Tax=Aspergillus pseudonomiae TaxID=1506151 RepID=A0A5N7DAL2_9EURO|nr:uncharacterized protein BDV37DRAFT_250853 [Aspergillus pseudonomiae]KAE8403185.1 hypothetical protein BDV37DRAFT_250853 [Aspergillus pseudonomiae]
MAIRVPPGQLPPFETVDGDHHAGIIIIVSAICLVLSLVSLLIRLYVRFLLSPPFGIDDVILLGATVSAIVESIIVFQAASIGFGTAIHLLDDHVVRSIQNSVVASDVFYLITLYLSRCCVVAIYSRLTPRRRHKNTLWGILAFTTAGTIISILVVTVDCSLNKPWVTPGEHCANLFARWQFITAIDIFTEMALFIFSAVLIYGLQMAIKPKLVVMVAFASRIPLVAFEAVRLSEFHSFTTTHNPTFDAIKHFTWTQVALNYSLIACTAFCLRPFMNAVSTSYGTAGDSNLSTSYPYASDRGRSTQGSYALQSLQNRSVVAPEPDLFRPRIGAGETTVTSAQPGSSTGGHSDRDDRNSIGSEGSTKMIIKKDVEYTVHHSPNPNC